MDEKMKLQMIDGINKSKDIVIGRFRFMFQYPFHPDTTFILLEIDGYYGDFGISVTQMSGWGRQLNTNAHGEDNSDLTGFIFHIYDNIDQDESEIVEDDELVEEIDEFAKDYFVSFFKKCFDEAGGKQSKLPYYLFYPNSGDTYDLLNDKWTYPQ
ncbi:hypothetical protein [Thermoactinomyces sp. CICC 10521]|uniref:hypothetical protein n=1 Tax=Thermoactinomyces sp. CICC 10521 TaxID=2767426 RepID=UPI0018DB274D|nr:hypothetical protein [Thermoactinomyces sp. CICC 10521]MBH8609357.1 hypothetical protein [Thermoactinomyces sp. CICC 10521]